MIKTGLYFGSFNPIHIGHMAIANYMVEYTEIDQLWFVVSPQNPLKKKKTLLDDYQRLELVNRSIGDDLRFRASKVEFSLPKPSYTIDTLAYMSDKYPTHQFFILMGSDNLDSIHKWKNAEVLLDNYDIIVYPRPGFNPEIAKKYPRVQVANAPLMAISSTFIRESIKAGKDVRHFLPYRTWDYLSQMNFYKK
ncbi:MAG TPA: nicotinate (nicotinamide) nucleotide adenylyltransferase [Prolixibacteraceae bacterium]|nr:nicotinate (nicotinamide) nucleotide adenylyltransferase [Prolixibacteraceae bacterium]